MTADARVAAAREAYADRIRSSGLRSAALHRAFATVPRERFLGPGPWHVLEWAPFEYRTTPDADPVHLYRDLPVAIDPARLLNNGQPSFVAGLIDALDLRAGERVTHVGAGTGYYTAILASIVGSAGSVTALEIDPDLAVLARTNLTPWPQVTVAHVDGGAHDSGVSDAIFVNAGATHPRSVWLDGLAPGGRLVLPLVRWPTREDEAAFSGTGIVVRVERGRDGYAARVLSSCMIFPCAGAIDPEADRRLGAALARPSEAEAVRELRRDPHEPEAACWLHGTDFCLRLG